MAWQVATRTKEDRIAEALEMYRMADAIVRECVQAELCGCETPESYDRLERLAIKNGEKSFESRRLDRVNHEVGWILRCVMPQREPAATADDVTILASATPEQLERFSRAATAAGHASGRSAANDLSLWGSTVADAIKIAGCKEVSE